MRLYHQKGCKTWSVQFSIEGRKFYRSLGTRNKEAANAKALEIIKELQMETDGLLRPKVERDTAQTPLLELLQKWVDIGLPPHVIPKHRTNSLNRPTKVIRECGWKRVCDITAEGFEAWRTRYFKEVGWAPKTLNEYLSHLRAFLKWMEKRGMIGANPLKPVDLLPNPKGDSKRPFYLDEFIRLVNAVPEYRSCLYRIAGFTGLRRSELMALEWNRVTLNDDSPRIELLPSKTKNRKGGTLPLLPDALDAMKVLRRLAPKGEKKVFFRGVTQMLRFRKDLKLAGIAEKDDRGRGLEFHSFRRTLATMLAKSGVSSPVATKLMRHASIQQWEAYMDEFKLIPQEELEKMPTLKSSPKSSPKIGKTCPSVSTDGNESPRNEKPQSLVNQVFGVCLSTFDLKWGSGKMERVERIELS